MWIIKNVYLISIQSWTHLYIKWTNVNSDSWHCIFMALLTVTKLLISPHVQNKNSERYILP